jgi:hypothetical protein
MKEETAAACLQTVKGELINLMEDVFATVEADKAIDERELVCRLATILRLANGLPIKRPT